MKTVYVTLALLSIVGLSYASFTDESGQIEGLFDWADHVVIAKVKDFEVSKEQGGFITDPWYRAEWVDLELEVIKILKGKERNPKWPYSYQTLYWNVSKEKRAEMIKNEIEDIKEGHIPFEKSKIYLIFARLKTSSPIKYHVLSCREIKPNKNAKP
jgi:hypothetical protein